MLIAYKCYDVNNDESLSKDEVKVMLKSIPFVSSEQNVQGKAGLDSKLTR